MKGLNFVGFITAKVIPACISKGQSSHAHQWFQHVLQGFLPLSKLQATSVTSEYFITAHSTQLQFSSKHIFKGLNFVGFITEKVILASISMGQSCHVHQQFKHALQGFNLKHAAGNLNHQWVVFNSPLQATSVVKQTHPQIKCPYFKLVVSGEITSHHHNMLSGLRDWESRITYSHQANIQRWASCIFLCLPLFFFFFFFFLIWVLRPFQEYFTYIEPIVHRRWAKTGEPGEKPPDHP